MYPNEILLGMGMYELLIALGFFCALLYFRIFADRFRFSAKLQNLVILCALASLIGGYGFAVLFQAVYNGLETGVYEVANNTGATFYGGLIGGTGIFIAIYFLAGRFVLKQGEARENFALLSEIAAGSIAVAHGMGRLGCLFAGCCHGAKTDAWYGIYHHYLKTKVIPVQLYEAVFLFAICAFLTWRLIKGRRSNLAVYLTTYAIWRFLAEYLRADDRGASVVAFLSPSQFTAVVLFLVGVLLLILAKRRSCGRGEQRENENA